MATAKSCGKVKVSHFMFLLRCIRQYPPLSGLFTVLAWGRVMLLYGIFSVRRLPRVCDYSVTKWDSSEIDTVWYMSYQALQQLMFLVTSLQIAIHFWHYICNKFSMLFLLIFMFPVCKFWRHHRSEILLSVRIWKVMNMVLRQCLFGAGTEIFFDILTGP